MIVYFSGSARELEKDAPVFREVLNLLQGRGVVLANNWVEGAAFREMLPQNIEWWREIVSQAAIGIRDADVVIVEGSGRSGLGVGYELAEALRLEKPVILLISKKEQDDSYAAGIKHPLLTICFYELFDVATRLQEALRVIERKKGN